MRGNTRLVIGAVLFIALAFFWKRCNDNQAEYDRQAAALDRIISTDSKQIQQKQQIEDAKDEARRSRWKQDLTFTYKRYKKGGFGSVGLHSFSIRNKSKQRNWKDLQLEIIYYGQSGTVLGSKVETLYSLAPAGRTLTKADFNAGFVNAQADKALIKLVGASEF